MARLLAQVRKVFDMFDADGGGSIDATEMRALLNELCIPMRDDELLALVKRLDTDGSGELDYEEFFGWYAVEAAGKTKGIRGGVGSAMLKVGKMSRAYSGETSLGEACRVVIACAQHDASKCARERFRSCRPPSKDPEKQAEAAAQAIADAEDDAAKEIRFAPVRAVLGRPTLDGAGGSGALISEADARRFRARRLWFHEDLWQPPPPPPKSLPPDWANSGRPMLADPADRRGLQIRRGMNVEGFDPSVGKRSGASSHKGLLRLGAAFSAPRRAHARAGAGGAFFAAVALRKSRQQEALDDQSDGFGGGSLRRGMPDDVDADGEPLQNSELNALRRSRRVHGGRSNDATAEAARVMSSSGSNALVILSTHGSQDDLIDDSSGVGRDSGRAAYARALETGAPAGAPPSVLQLTTNASNGPSPHEVIALLRADNVNVDEAAHAKKRGQKTSAPFDAKGEMSKTVGATTAADAFAGAGAASSSDKATDKATDKANPSGAGAGGKGHRRGRNAGAAGGASPTAEAPIPAAKPELKGSTDYIIHVPHGAARAMCTFKWSESGVKESVLLEGEFTGWRTLEMQVSAEARSTFEVGSARFAVRRCASLCVAVRRCASLCVAVRRSLCVGRCASVAVRRCASLCFVQKLKSSKDRTSVTRCRRAPHTTFGSSSSQIPTV